MRDPSPQPCPPAAPRPSGRPAPATPRPGDHAPPNPPPAGAPAAPRFRGGSARSWGCPSFQSVVAEPGLTTPRGAPETSRPKQGPCSPTRNLSSDSSSGSERPTAAGFPPADIPVVKTSAAPPPPALAGSSPFGRSRSCHPQVPLIEGWRRPPPYLSFRRRSAVSCAGVSSSHQPLRTSQQRKHVTARAKTLSVTQPWPIRVGAPRPGRPWEL